MSFEPRLTRPEKGNPYYNTKGNGGYSTAIKGKPTDPDCDVLHNCVGYAFGRYNEIAGAKDMRHLLPVNAERFVEIAKQQGLTIGDTPKLGAVMCWQKGATLSGDDGAGHVAVVEKVISENEVTTSESGYGAKQPFWVQNRRRGTNWGQSAEYKFLGFIYQPAQKATGNSPLVNYTKLSPNCNKPRSHKIDKITIHHMAGNLTVEQCGSVFAPTSRKASSNYGIGTDGRVGMYVEECNRSWCSSSPENDHRAVTIEVANDQIGGDWHVSDTALAKLIDLCVDICQRNGIEKLNYTGDKSGNLTMHKWFAATACPGPYLESKFPYIAQEVNKRLPAEGSTAEPPASSGVPFLVRVTATDLNIRKGAGTNFAKTGKYTGTGVFTITEVKSGPGASAGWGKLKSGAGWISLDFCTKI